jgi:site-specific recombinase XerD
MENDADINTVSKLLGQKSVQTAAIYAQATNKLRQTIHGDYGASR